MQRMYSGSTFLEHRRSSNQGPSSGEYVHNALEKKESSSSGGEDKDDEEVEAKKSDKVEVIKTRGIRLRRMLRNMRASCKPLLPEDKTCFAVLNQALTSVEIDQDPITFEDAINRPNGWEWQEAIDLELWHMTKKGMWRVVKKCDVPRNRRLIGTKWVFQTKKGGRRHARVNR